QRPVGDRITAVHHRVCFSIWRCDRPGVQMITPDNDRSVYLTCTHQLIKCKSRFFPFSLSQPANAGRQALECDFFSGQSQPTLQRFILRKEFCDNFIGYANIIWITAQCCPAKRTFAFTKKRPDISRNKAGKKAPSPPKGGSLGEFFELRNQCYIGIFFFELNCSRSYIIPVVEGDSAFIH